MLRKSLNARSLCEDFFLIKKSLHSRLHQLIIMKMATSPTKTFPDISQNINTHQTCPFELRRQHNATN